MRTVRTARSDEPGALLAFVREYVGHEESHDSFQRKYEQWPDLFVVAREDGDLVGGASGSVDDGVARLEAIGATAGRRGEGIGTAVIDQFHQGAARYADAVTVASAENVEWFYEAAGYEPAKILLQVEDDALPADYRRHEHYLGERSPEEGVTFCYVGFEAYSQRLRDELKDEFGAFEVNTIFRKRLPD
ncbi:GNAT family N-acetyltransferase [Haloarchaeobius amylolyticus]|uniref:GNAT family N-acetyltransferase n=1 Tax=Haloarchaeobius amylolyticus TaxID=1198296 RepID=UPI00226F0B4B|nr:GNAT family N-acetyltransferase [Haloarchaeobius amylolyticus]